MTRGITVVINIVVFVIVVVIARGSNDALKCDIALQRTVTPINCSDTSFVTLSHIDVMFDAVDVIAGITLTTSLRTDRHDDDDDDDELGTTHSVNALLLFNANDAPCSTPLLASTDVNSMICSPAASSPTCRTITLCSSVPLLSSTPPRGTVTAPINTE